MMNDDEFDTARTHHREVVATVEPALSGPAPELRECPFCKHVGMCDATVCGYCWAMLPSLERAVPGASR
jgi:hypothetical protein